MLTAMAIVLILAIAAVVLAAERLFPGRELPQSPGWTLRAILLNAIQLAVVVLGGHTWSHWLQGPSLFLIDGRLPTLVQGFICWFLGTFIFYWWHRARHGSAVLWRLHQIHHSAARIEGLTSFYKHPLEIAINSILSTAIVFVLLGASVEAAPWYSFFAAIGEFYYHMNVSTPHWTGYFLQRPEHHSIHHQRGVHRHNYGDLTWWDRLFGTFKDTDSFVAECGYDGEREQRFVEMLGFQDVNGRGSLPHPWDTAGDLTNR
jgi:sterol desaturase/sphingolipid hydroxylase (fatty acid hydroxylase superfamily)